MYVLLTKLRHVYASGDASAHLVPDEALQAFMEHCAKRVGDAYFRTPRTTVKEFVNLLAVLEQNPNADWRELVGSVQLTPETNPDLEPLAEAETGHGVGTTAAAAPAAAASPVLPDEDDDELASFKL